MEEDQDTNTMTSWLHPHSKFLELLKSTSLTHHFFYFKQIVTHLITMYIKFLFKAHIWCIYVVFPCRETLVPPEKTHQTDPSDNKTSYVLRSGIKPVLQWWEPWVLTTEQARLIMSKIKGLSLLNQNVSTWNTAFKLLEMSYL